MKTLFGLILFLLLTTGAKATTRAAATCNLTDVQAAVTAAVEGDTVTIPAGSCTWTNGVTISGKGITVTGAGSGRIVAVSTNQLAIVNGTLSLTIASDNSAGTLPTLTAGQTLTVNELGAEANFMTGTVTSLTGSALVMNITSHGGACGSNGNSQGPSNCKRWTLATPATTTIVNNSTSNSLWTVTLDASVHDDFSGVYYSPGTAQSHIFSIQGSGAAPIIHDGRFTANPNLPGGSDSNRDVLNFNTNEGVVYNNTFDCTQFNVAAVGGVTTKEVSDNGSWESVANWGSTDTTGQTAIYIETNDFHAFGFATANDDNGRMVVRHNFYNNSGMMGTHGADTSPFGQRYFELYSNVAVFQANTDGSTFNLNNWGYLRGGTGIIWGNTMPALQSQDYGSKNDFDLTVQNLQRNSGPDPCWGAGTSGGAEYHAPRQVGMGYVTGTGHDGLGRSRDANAYVGDLEPIYIWSNSRAPLNTGMPDYGSGNPDSCTGSTYDTNANYIHTSRDWYPNTAKPSYSPFTYPHPLANPTPPPPNFPLSVTKSGTGGGTVTSSPAGINCGSTCSVNFNSGTSVTLTATPDGSSTFAGWAGPCSGTGTCNVTVNSSLSVTATYTLNPPPGTAPSFSPGGATYATAQSVSVTSTNPLIFYTTDGYTPNTASTPYSSPISIISTTTLQAISAAGGSVRRNTQALAVTNNSSGWKICTPTGGGPGTPASVMCGGVGSTQPSNWLVQPGTTETISVSATSGAPQILVTLGGSGCDSCTELTMDKWIKPLDADTNVENHEHDAWHNDSTHNRLHMGGLQCNQQSAFLQWQVDNEQGSWQNTGITDKCPLSTSLWTHIVFHIHWIIGDTGCGGLGCTFYDYLDVCTASSPAAGCTLAHHVINKQLESDNPGWGAGCADQDQVDLRPNGTYPKTGGVLVQANNVTCAFGVSSLTSAIYNISSVLNPVVNFTGAISITGQIHVH